jgi:hypothetical protein
MVDFIQAALTRYGRSHATGHPGAHVRHDRLFVPIARPAPRTSA